MVLRLKNRHSFRILMVINKFWPLIGGAEKQARILSRELYKKGVHVKILTGAYSVVPRGWSQVDQVPVYRHVVPRIPVKDGRSLHGYGYMLSLPIILYKLRTSFDLIHVHQMTYGAWSSAAVARVIKKPVITKVSNTGANFDLHQLRKALPVFYRLMLPTMLKNTTRLIAICSETINELEGIGVSKAKIDFIPNGVEIPADNDNSKRSKFRNRLGINPETFLICFVGRLVYQKNVSNLLAAIKYLKEAYFIEPLLILVGDGKMKISLMEEAKKLKISHLVHFAGAVNDTIPYFRAADVFVLPSLAEGLSNALLEAMAHRLPCIASDVGGNPDIIQNGGNGLLVPSGDSRALATEIRKLHNNPELRARLGNSARKKVEKEYDIESIADRYIDLYHDILNPGGK